MSVAIAIRRSGKDVDRRAAMPLNGSVPANFQRPELGLVARELPDDTSWPV